MEYMPFLIWMIFWPFANSVSNYLYALQRKIEGKDAVDGLTRAIAALIHLFIWVWIAKHLWPI
jgi:hypothetical protein